MTIIHIAWRNVWRNKKRSILSFSSISASCIIITLLFGLLAGLDEDVANNLKTYVSGDIRIRNKEYQENEKLNPIPYFVAERRALQDRLANLDALTAVLPRIVLPVTTFRDNRDSFIVEGVDPALNEQFRDFSSYILEGEPLEGAHSGIIPAVIGEGLAKKLQLNIGDQVTTLTTTVYRSSNAMTFTIVGIARLGIPPVNQTTLFVPIIAAERLSMMAGGASEVLIRIAPGSDIDAVQESIQSALADENLTIQQWDTVSTTSVVVRFAQYMYAFIALIFFILGSIAIVNTTIMAIFERKHEIGLLGSLGMRQALIRRLFFLESLCIALIGSGIGVLIGTGIVVITGQVGIDIASQMDGIDFEFSSVLYPRARFWVVAGVFLYSVVVSSVATLIPTRKIVKMQPVEALQEE